MKRRLDCLQPSRSSCAFVCLAVVLVVARTPASFATTCTDICPGTGACTIGSLHNIDPGSTLSCIGRDLTIGDAGSLKVTGGDLKLLADDLTLTGPGGLIYAVEGASNTAGTIEIHLTGSLIAGGKIRANGNHSPGSIYLDVAGDIVILENGTDGLECDGLAPHASGGDIVVKAGGSISIYDPIHCDGNISGDSGGGSISIRAVGNIDVGQDGHLSAPGKTEGGGHISLESETGNITFAEHADADGKGPTGDGGTIEFSAGGSIAINGELYARGGVNAEGGTATGGHVLLEAGCAGAAINASIFVTGGQLGTGEDGGAIDIDTAGDIALASGAVLDAHALASGGDGGPISLRAGDLVTVASGATIDSRGSSVAPGRGGDISIRGCRVDIQSTATLDTTGAEGGTISAAATAVPPANGTQPLFVSRLALVKAKGASSDVDGSLSISPLTLKNGQCSNNATISCVGDPDCVQGCQNGDCLYANPDTEGVVTQFDVAPISLADHSLGECQASCN